MAHQVGLCQISLLLSIWCCAFVSCFISCIQKHRDSLSDVSRSLVKPTGAALYGWSKGKGMGSSCVLARGLPALLRERFKYTFIA